MTRLVNALASLGFGLVLVGAFIMASDAQQPASNPVQDQIEKTIGSLVVQNTQCSAHTLALNLRVQELQKQLDDAKKTASKEPAPPAPSAPAAPVKP